MKMSNLVGQFVIVEGKAFLNASHGLEKTVEKAKTFASLKAGERYLKTHAAALSKYKKLTVLQLTPDNFKVVEVMDS